MNLKLLSLLSLSALLAGPQFISAQGTAFTYQGRLNNNGVGANGSYDLTFGLYTNSTGGTAAAGPVTNANSGVSNGLFTTTLNFNNAFASGAAYWLEIEVRGNGGGAFTVLSPRQPVTPAPYAITAGNLSGPLPAGQLSGALPPGALSGVYSNAVNFTNPANTFNGNGGGLTNLPIPTQGDYLFAYSTSSQTSPIPPASYYILLDANGPLDGWSRLGNGFAAAHAGVYQIQYQVQIEGSYGVSLGSFNVLSNGFMPFPGSQSVLGAAPNSVSRCFMTSLSAGDFIAVANNLFGTGNGSSEVTSNASLSVIRIK